jgi:hypothetical protein
VNKKMNPDLEIAKDMGRFFNDPLGFVMYAFPWGSDPSLQIVRLQEPWASRYNSEYGPDSWFCEMCDEWQAHMLANPFDGKTAVPPFKDATSSGHGIGKSCSSAFIIMYIISTRPFSKGVVTSNTSDQLRTKTWGELAKWKNKCITGHWFELNNGKGNMNIFHKKHKDTWRADAITCREENSESFAGLHCANSSPWYLFDEASAVPDKIWEVAEGGTTDGQPFWFAFGNPTRNSGRFRECWRKFRKSWNTRKVDSRTVQVTNKGLIENWRNDYGDDSDFFKVRVKGEFPAASANQKIPNDLLERAMEDCYEVPLFPTDAKVMSLDVARGGDDDCVFDFRQGLNGRIKRRIVLPGSDYRDSTKLVAKALEIARDFNPDYFFVDATGVGGPVSDQINQLGQHCIAINFASSSPNPAFGNMRAYMADQLLQWLKAGGLVESDDDLKTECGAVEYLINNKGQEMLIPKDDIKKSIGISTDKFDALMLLHAMPTAPVANRGYNEKQSNRADTSYNPWDNMADMDYNPW